MIYAHNFKNLRAAVPVDPDPRPRAWRLRGLGFSGCSLRCGASFPVRGCLARSSPAGSGGRVRIWGSVARRARAQVTRGSHDGRAVRLERARGPRRQGGRARDRRDAARARLVDQPRPGRHGQVAHGRAEVRVSRGAQANQGRLAEAGAPRAHGDRDVRQELLVQRAQRGGAEGVHDGHVRGRARQQGARGADAGPGAHPAVGYRVPFKARGAAPFRRQVGRRLRCRARARGAARSRFTMRARALCCRDPVTRSCSARAPTSLPSTTRWRPSSHRRPRGCSLRPAVRAAARPPRPRRGAVPRRRTSSRSCARTSARSRRRLRSAAKCFRTRRASRTTTRSPKLSDSSRSVRATLSAARARALAR